MTVNVGPRARLRYAVLQMLPAARCQRCSSGYSLRVLSKVQRSEVSVASLGCDFGPLGVGRGPVGVGWGPVRRLRALGKLWGAKFMTTPLGEIPTQSEQGANKG
jgi:hypothetical protein